MLVATAIVVLHRGIADAATRTVLSRLAQECPVQASQMLTQSIEGTAGSGAKGASAVDAE